jgi:amino acid transporter
VISFIIAGISALLSALCYSEFAVQYPFAGGAYNYISLTLGELAAWLTVTTLVLVRQSGHHRCTCLPCPCSMSVAVL